MYVMTSIIFDLKNSVLHYMPNNCITHVKHVESRTPISNGRDLDSHEDHRTCCLHTKIAADKYSRRLCERIPNGQAFDWTDDRLTSPFESKLPNTTVLGLCVSAKVLNHYKKEVYRRLLCQTSRMITGPIAICE